MAEQSIGFGEGLKESDRALSLEIRKTLWNYEPIRATRPSLHVQIEDGLVYLSGRLRTMAMKEIAEYMVLRISGVRALRNEISTDPDVVRAVADALAADDGLAPACVQVQARDGEVTLSGSVPDGALISRALELASGVPMVKDVHSRLVVQSVRPEPSANGAMTVEERRDTAEE